MSKSKFPSVAFQPGTICSVNSTYEAVEEEELSFKEGEIVTLLEAKDDSYYQASLTDGTIGLVHERRIVLRKAIPLLPMPWYHGSLSRFDAEKLLDCNCLGQFIIRSTKHGKRTYALSMSCAGGIVHYLIATDRKKQQVTLDGKRFFKNLLELVEYYKENKEVLREKPIDPLNRKGILEFYVDLATMKQEWGIKRKDVEFGDKIGSGEFGDVFSGVYREFTVAIKTLKQESADSAAVAEFSREAAILTNLRHKNIVQLVGFLFTGTSLQGIVMEMMSKGSLLKYLSTRGRSVITLKQLISFSLDVCEGMCYLSQRGFVHRDLAARNILLNRNGEAKISDLGLSRKSGIFVPHEGGKFPIKWTAPEALKYSKFSVKSDVWSFGILLWEVFSYGRVPYPSVSVDDVMRFLEDGNVMEPPEGCPSSAQNIMLSCWHMEPEKRPTFENLKCMLESFKVDSSDKPRSPSLTSRSAKTKAIPSSYPIESLARSTETMLLYSDVLRKNRTVSIYNTNLLFLGPEGSGKSSLLRNFRGQPFRNIEPASLSASISQIPLELSLKSWEPSSKGFSVEENRLRCVVEDLVGSLKKLSTSSLSYANNMLVPPPVPSSMRPSSSPKKSSTTDDIDTRLSENCTDGLPLVRRHTFSDRHKKYRPLSSADVPVAGISVRVNGDTGDDTNGMVPNMLEVRNDEGPSTIKKIFGSFRKHGSGKKISTEIKAKSSSGDVTPQPSVSPDLTNVNGNGMVPSPIPSPIPDSDSDSGSQNWARNPSSSNLSEDTIQGIVYGLEQCKLTHTLPPVCSATSVDLPGSNAHSLIRPLFFTKKSLPLITFDMSRNFASTESLTRYGSCLSLVSTQSTGSQLFEVGYTKRTYLDCIINDMLDVYLHIPSNSLEEQLANTKIILVGTHIEKSKSFIHMTQQLKSIKEAASDLPCKPLLSPQPFGVSSSSILEQSNIEDLRKGIINHVKKYMRQTVPIGWLEALGEVQSLYNSRELIVPKTKFAESISRFCVSSEEVENLIQFFHDNLFIYHPSHVHMLKDVVITDAKWFARNISVIFSITHPSNSSRMKPHREDVKQLKATGHLSKTLIEQVWKGVSLADQSRLLILMHTMDLLVCLDAQRDIMSFNHQWHFIEQSVVTSAIVPALIQQYPPVHLFAEPECNIEPLYFRFKGGYLPSDLFPRLVARCIRSYPSNYNLYKGLATFDVDETVTAFVQEMDDCLRVWVQVDEFMNRSSSSPNGSVVSVNSSTLHSRPSSDLCMALLMFLKATISDVIHQWIPQLDYDLCVECNCSGGSGGKTHYAVLNDTELWMGPQLLTCEDGNEITPLVGVTRWFGSIEAEVVDMAIATDALELVTDEDIQLISESLGGSWRDLGEILGFSSPELNVIEATSSTSMGESTPQTGDSPPLKHSEPKRHSAPIPLNRLSSTSSRIMKKLRQSVFSTADLLFSSELPPAHRMLLHWQRDNGNQATLSCLISALEIIQRRDIADCLIESRIDGPGFVI